MTTLLTIGGILLVLLMIFVAIVKWRRYCEEKAHEEQKQRDREASERFERRVRENREKIARREAEHSRYVKTPIAHPVQSRPTERLRVERDDDKVTSDDHTIINAAIIANIVADDAPSVNFSVGESHPHTSSSGYDSHSHSHSSDYGSSHSSDSSSYDSGSSSFDSGSSDSGSSGGCD